MREIVDKTPGSELTGLEHRLKTPESFKEKLAGAIEEYPDLSVSEHLEDMKDSVRYTFKSNEATYTQNVNEAISQLKSDGYEPVNFKNFWGKVGYQGINSFWRDSATGHIFEVQFHTPSSFDAKMVTHPWYEEWRQPGIAPEREAELERLQNEVFDTVPTPPGSPDIRLPESGDR